MIATFTLFKGGSRRIVKFVGKCIIEVLIAYFCTPPQISLPASATSIPGLFLSTTESEKKHFLKRAPVSMGRQNRALVRRITPPALHFTFLNPLRRSFFITLFSLFAFPAAVKRSSVLILPTSALSFSATFIDLH